MRLYPRQRPPVGELASPLPLVDEIRALVAKANAIDRWNINGTIPTAKVARGAYGRSVGPVGTEVVQTITLPFQDYGPPDALPGPAPRLGWHAVTDSAGDPWVTEIETGDCLLEVSWSCATSVTWTVGYLEHHVWYRHVVHVDEVALRGPWCAYGTKGDSTPVLGNVVLPAGVHQIRPYVETWAIVKSVDATIDLTGRQMLAIEKAR